MTKTHLNISPLLAGLALCSVNLAAHAGTVAVLGLYQTEQAMPGNVITQVLADQAGCDIRRRAGISKSVGSYKLGGINGFFLLECTDQAVAGNAGRSLARQLKRHSSNIRLLQGPMQQFGEQALSSPMGSRRYIVKISNYNNISPPRRHADLAKLGKMVEGRKNQYVTEAAVRVNDAYGMARPDEAVVIFYKEASAGPLFRKNNADVLEKIGAFNKDHLSRFSYLFLGPNAN